MFDSQTASRIYSFTNVSISSSTQGHFPCRSFKNKTLFKFNFRHFQWSTEWTNLRAKPHQCDLEPVCDWGTSTPKHIQANTSQIQVKLHDERIESPLRRRIGIVKNHGMAPKQEETIAKYDDAEREFSGPTSHRDSQIRQKKGTKNEMKKSSFNVFLLMTRSPPPRSHHR